MDKKEMKGEAMIQQVIDRLEGMSKQGVSYDSKGRHGWRNPVRSDTGPFLAAFGKLPQVKRILEVGTAYGLSACYLGMGGAEITTIEWDEEVGKEAQANLDEAGVEAHVVCGDALVALQVIQKKFDLVFMDANKDGYLEQIKLIEPKLNPGAIILADNVIDRQAECQNFLDYMAGRSIIIPTECGLLVGQLP